MNKLNHKGSEQHETTTHNGISKSIKYVTRASSTTTKGANVNVFYPLIGSGSDNRRVIRFFARAKPIPVAWERV